jgi:hypothetical protein
MMRKTFVLRRTDWELDANRAKQQGASTRFRPQNKLRQLAQ